MTETNYVKVLKAIKAKLKPDQYYKETIYSLYFDTDHNDLIINSINKPLYREKVRLRAYEVPTTYSYFELKRKYQDITYKRRLMVTYEAAEAYLTKGIKPAGNEQLVAEIDYAIKHNHLKPKVNIVYDREAYVSKDDANLRLTFDHNIKYSKTELALTELKTKPLFKGYIMEVKARAALPLWLTKTLTELKIYPVAFSKYGKIYTELKEIERNV